MATQEELKKIKKTYGEDFMHWCRENFPTILEKEGRLYEILTSRFAGNSKTLYNDIMASRLDMKLKDFIYSEFGVDEKKEEQSKGKSPYELLAEAGYTLTECHTEGEIQRFKKYYAKGEELCTFHGGRLDRYLVFWAVKKDAENIKRTEFEAPEREDEYGISVMGIQFNKEGRCMVSIKNRYNHTVDNPDATYGNDLDKIAPGLRQSFAELLETRGLELKSDNVEGFKIPGYTVAGDGKYYKYNLEVNGTYYCPGNIIIENGVVKRLEKPESQILADYFVIDTKDKTIQVYNNYFLDSFVDALQDIEKIEVRKGEEKTRIVTVVVKGQESKVTIELDEDNQIIGYQNDGLTEVGDIFLFGNRKLSWLEVINLTKIGRNFLEKSRYLRELDLPKLEEVGSGFLFDNTYLDQINLPSLVSVGDSFLFGNRRLKSLQLPSLKKTGNWFLSCNEDLEELEVGSLEEVGEEFLNANIELRSLDVPRLEKAGGDFLRGNKKLEQIDAPSLVEVGNNFLAKNTELRCLKLPSLVKAKNSFLQTNEELEQLEMPSLREVGDEFLKNNTELTSLELPCLERAGNSFVFCNDKIQQLEVENLAEVRDGFLSSGGNLREVEFPSLRKVGSHFLWQNHDLEHLKADRLEKIGDNFLSNNARLRSLELPSLEEVGADFLAYNKSLKAFSAPKLRKAGQNFLRLNKTLFREKLSGKEKLKYWLFGETEAMQFGVSDIVLLDKTANLTTSEVGMGKRIIDRIVNLTKEMGK